MFFFLFFNVLQIFNLTMKPTIQSASVGAKRAFSAVASATTPQSMRCASYEMRCQSSKC